MAASTLTSLDGKFVRCLAEIPHMLYVDRTGEILKSRFTDRESAFWLSMPMEGALHTIQEGAGSCMFQKKETLSRT